MIQELGFGLIVGVVWAIITSYIQEKWTNVTAVILIGLSLMFMDQQSILDLTTGLLSLITSIPSYIITKHYFKKGLK